MFPKSQIGQTGILLFKQFAAVAKQVCPVKGFL